MHALLNTEFACADPRGSGAAADSFPRSSPSHIRASVGTGPAKVVAFMGALSRLWAGSASGPSAPPLFTLRAVTVNAVSPDCLLIKIGDGVDCLLIAKQRFLRGLPPPSASWLTTFQVLGSLLLLSIQRCQAFCCALIGRPQIRCQTLLTIYQRPLW